MRLLVCGYVRPQENFFVEGVPYESAMATLVEAIAARCTEVETGARNVDHIIRGNLLPRLSSQLLEQMSGEEMPSKLPVPVAQRRRSVTTRWRSPASRPRRAPRRARGCA